MDIARRIIREKIIDNCRNAKIREDCSYGLANGFHITTSLWNDELTITLDDIEGYELESQTLDFYEMTKEDLEEIIDYLLDCVEKFAKSNLLNKGCSFIITDIKGDLITKFHNFFKDEQIKICRDMISKY